MSIIQGLNMVFGILAIISGLGGFIANIFELRDAGLIISMIGILITFPVGILVIFAGYLEFRSER